MTSGYGRSTSYAEVLAQIGEENDAVFALDADLPGRTRLFAKRFPDRYMQAGIAEQNIMSIASGLAARGKVPIVHIMAPFGTMRSFEQIRTDIAYARRNVKIVGACGGLSGGPWGPTHHTIEDIALMRVIPGMSVILPCNEAEQAAALRAAVAHDGPVYIRQPGPAGRKIDLPDSFQIGKGIHLREGKNIALLTTGNLLADCLDAADDLSKDGIEIAVVHLPTVKPMDEALLGEIASEHDRIVTVEEHSVIGGLGGAVAEFLCEHGGLPVHRIGIPDCFCEVTGSYEQLKDRYGLGARAIAERIRSLCS
ncbi:MAG: transketolase C-terminal domain-containing protein [Planctomycetota bacterium]